MEKKEWGEGPRGGGERIEKKIKKYKWLASSKYKMFRVIGKRYYVPLKISLDKNMLKLKFVLYLTTTVHLEIVNKMAYEKWKFTNIGFGKWFL